MDLKKEILEQRTIKENSLNAYLIILKKLNDNKKIENLNFLKNTDSIIEKIKEKALTTQRNYIGAVLVALPLLEDNESTLNFYKTQLEKINSQYKENIDSHEKTDKQKNNWLSLEELNNIFLKYKKNIKKNKYNEKENFSKKEFNYYTNYLIVALYNLLPPTRLDFAPMILTNDEKEDDNESNFLVNQSRNRKHFIINEYKSSKTYGKKIIKIPPELNSIINVYLKHHPKNSASFLFNTRGEPLSANGLSKLLTSSYGRYTNKNITLNLLRHVYISENIKLKKDTEEAKIAKAMMHSEATQQTYIKID